VISAITQIFTGFSILSAPILVIAYLFFLRDMGKSRIGRIACVLLLGSMLGLQIFHWLFLQSVIEPFEYRAYVLLQLACPPAFFFFCREVLVPGSTKSPLHVLHLAPLALSPFVSIDLIPPFAFIVGAGYSIWFAMYVFGLRRHVHRYLFELSFFAYFMVLAIVMLVLAASAQNIGTNTFYLSYAMFTGVTFVLVIAVMIWFPQVLVDMSDAARLSYATSTLSGVNVDAKLAALRSCMDEDKLFGNENLNLGMLADALELTPHQLSELINTQFGYGFSRYVRERRISEAIRLLQEDRSASVLSIGLTTGFSSQSNFYAAFREITGDSPGAFRKRNGSA